MLPNICWTAFPSGPRKRAGSALGSTLINQGFHSTPDKIQWYVRRDFHSADFDGEYEVDGPIAHLLVVPDGIHDSSDLHAFYRGQTFNRSDGAFNQAAVRLAEAAKGGTNASCGEHAIADGL